MKNYIFITKINQPKQTIEKLYTLVRHTLANDNQYHFVLAINKNWKVVDIAIKIPDKEKPIGKIALFKRIEEYPAEIEINSFILSREINPSDWLNCWLSNNSYSYYDGRIIPSSYGTIGDYLATRQIDNETYVYRFISIKDANRLFLLTCRVNEQFYEFVSEEFLMAIQTFQLINPQQIRFSEEMKAYPAQKPVPAQFIFPSSWAVQSDKHSPVKGVSFNLLNFKNQDVMGFFSFISIPNDYEKNYTGLLDNYLTQLQNNQITIQTDYQLSEADNQFSERVKKIWQGKLNGHTQKGVLDIYCRIIEHENAWILIAMLGPDKKTNVEAEMINRRAYTIALETFKFL